LREPLYFKIPIEIFHLCFKKLLKSAPRRENLRDYGWRPTIKTTCEKVQLYRCVRSIKPEEY
jgi:hypothetical protein